jgi:hypothetical protein
MSGGFCSLTFVIREIVLHWAYWQLLLETIDLVEEENDGCLDEPPRIADGIEECEGFLHAVDGLVLEEQLVVFRDGNEEKDGGDILEAVNPLLALGSLAADIEHAVREVANDKRRFGDTGGLDTGAENVLVIWGVVGSGNAIDRVKVAGESNGELFVVV